jgi:hypothetical protein
VTLSDTVLAVFKGFAPGLYTRAEVLDKVKETGCGLPRAQISGALGYLASRGSILTEERGRTYYYRRENEPGASGELDELSDDDLDLPGTHSSATGAAASSFELTSVAANGKPSSRSHVSREVFNISPSSDDSDDSDDYDSGDSDDSDDLCSVVVRTATRQRSRDSSRERDVEDESGGPGGNVGQDLAMTDVPAYFGVNEE